MRITMQTEAADWGPSNGEGSQGAKALRQRMVEGVPYTAMHLVAHVQDEGLSPHTAIKALSETGLLHRLPWGYYALTDAKGEFPSVNLRQVLDGICASGVEFTLPSLIAEVEQITGETLKTDTVRRALDRLVQAGRFARSKPGTYVRTQRGLGEQI